MLLKGCDYILDNMYIVWVGTRVANKESQPRTLTWWSFTSQTNAPSR